MYKNFVILEGMKQMENFPVYLRMKRKLIAHTNQRLFVKDIAYISAPKNVERKIKETKLYAITNKNKEFAVLDCFQVIKVLNEKYPGFDFQQIGTTETIIHIKRKKKRTVLFRLL